MEEKELKTKSGFGVASLVLGIVSIMFASFWYVAIISGILAIIFGAKSIKKVGSKLGKAGLVTGIIGLVLSLFIYVSLVLVLFYVG